MNHKLCFYEVSELSDQIQDLQSEIRGLQLDLRQADEEKDRMARRVCELEKALDDIEYIQRTAR